MPSKPTHIETQNLQILVHFHGKPYCLPRTIHPNVKMIWNSSSSANCVTSPEGEIKRSMIAWKSMEPISSVLAVSIILDTKVLVEKDVPSVPFSPLACPRHCISAMAIPMLRYMVSYVVVSYDWDEGDTVIILGCPGNGVRRDRAGESTSMFQYQGCKCLDFPHWLFLLKIPEHTPNKLQTEILL